MLEDAFLPATLSSHPMTDEEFLAFCAEHPDLSFEMTADGELIVMPLTGLLTGARNMRISARLSIWAEQDGRGIATDSSTGFVLPNGARRAPDSAWTAKTEIRKHIPQNPEGLWHLTPAFVIGLRSPTDRLRTLRAKMQEYMDNGAQLGWLIDPETHAVEIYRPGRDLERLENIESVKGEGPVKGFVLDLRTVWDPFV